MVATNTPSLTSPLARVPSLRDVLERIPAKLGLHSRFSEKLENFADYNENKHILGLHDAPALESDTKRRRRTSIHTPIQFVCADADHPLAAYGSDVTVKRYNSKVTATQRKDTRVKEPASRPEVRETINFKPAYDSHPERINYDMEMTTWRQCHLPLRKTDCLGTPQLPRMNRDFLRMFIAQKLMFEHGKVKEISCSPLLPPRQRVSQNPECTLGVRHSWNKTYRRREWIGWNYRKPGC